MAVSLKSVKINKRRYRPQPLPSVLMLVDEFQGELDGIILAEAEFETPELLADFQTPDFAAREVTGDLRFTGVHLIKNGRPNDP